MKRTSSLVAARRVPALLLLAACIAFTPSAVLALDETRADVTAFIGEVSQKHGFESQALAKLFAQVESRQAIIDLISRPAEKTLLWHEYRAKFLTDRRITRGAEVWKEQEAALQNAETSGVPAHVILGIVGVETFFGEITGKHRVIDALATLAFDYPPRSKYFRGELEQFLLMSREEQMDPLAPFGSYAGAMGMPQFMPTSFRRWAVDGDGDGHRDLWGSWSDVFSSVGNYLRENGWRAGQPVMTRASVEGANLDGLEFGKLDLTETVASLRQRGVKFDTDLPGETPAVLVKLDDVAALEYRVGFPNFQAITRYNRSQLYASAVNDLAEAIEGAAGKASQTFAPGGWSTSVSTPTPAPAPSAP